MKLPEIIKRKHPRQYLLGGIFFILHGSVILMNPVMYTWKIQYDLRGWPKWFVFFLCVITGLYFIAKSLNKNKITRHVCTNCEYQEMLFTGEEYKCPLCKKSLSEEIKQ